MVDNRGLPFTVYMNMRGLVNVRANLPVSVRGNS